MDKFLDKTGLTYFANKIKAMIDAVTETASSALTAAGTASSKADSAQTAAKEAYDFAKSAVKTEKLTGTVESLKAGTYMSISIPYSVPSGYSFGGASVIGNGWTNGMISYIVYSSNSQIVVGNYAIAGDQANKTIAVMAIFIKN